MEDLAIASDRADSLASELRTLKPELLSQESFVRVVDEKDFVRVVDEKDNEIYRTPLEVRTHRVNH